MLLKTVTVVDARMGRGKTSAAIRYIQENRDSHRFLFVTPYLSEVQRICFQCGFDEAADDLGTKTADLRRKIRMKKNVAITHSLFYLMDMDMLDLARDNGYSLIIDESINIIEKIPTSAKDFTLITNTMTIEDETGRLTWVDDEYEGRFDDYKALADMGNLFHLDSALLNITNPYLFQAFDEVFMLTYLFEGQTQKAYLDYFEIPYRIVGVEKDECGYKFSDAPDCPPPMNSRGRSVNAGNLVAKFGSGHVGDADALADIQSGKKIKLSGLIGAADNQSIVIGAAEKTAGMGKDISSIPLIGHRQFDAATGNFQKAGIILTVDLQYGHFRICIFSGKTCHRRRQQGFNLADGICTGLFRAGSAKLREE